jgi:hypothetical protein
MYPVPLLWRIRVATIRHCLMYKNELWDKVNETKMDVEKAKAKREGIYNVVHRHGHKWF